MLPVATINSAGLTTGAGGGVASISATLSGITGSTSVNVQATTGCPCSIWGSPVPTIIDAGPDNPVELGVAFRADSNGLVTGVRFYKSAANTGTHVGNLWSSNGTLLATATFGTETASGWQHVNFSTPVAVTANTVYVMSYHTNRGHFSVDRNYFTVGVDNPPLHALANGVSGYGVYTYTAGSAFPANTTQSSNYWVDVVYSTGAANPPDR